MSEPTLNLSVQAETAAATKALIALAEAAERATAAIDGLDRAGHGGVTIQAVGDVVHIEIKPKPDVVDMILDDVKSGGPVSKTMENTYGVTRQGR